MTRLLLYLAVWLCQHLVLTTTRYLTSASSSSSSPMLVAPPPLLSSTLLLKADSFRITFPGEAKTATTLTSSRIPSVLASKVLHRDLIQLSRLLPGVYTNMEQYQRQADRYMPHRQRHILLRSSYRPVTLRFLPAAWAVLVQDYSGDSLFPFRQRVYTFSLDLQQRALRMKVWNFATKRIEKKATQNLYYFQTLRRKDLLSQGSCDMLWRRLDRTTFVGLTGKQCLGYVKGEQVRITVSMTLTSQLLQTSEGWYRTRDGKKLVEMDEPYNLLKTKSFTNNRKKQMKKHMPRTWRFQTNSAQNDLPLPLSPSSRHVTAPPADRATAATLSAPSTPASKRRKTDSSGKIETMPFLETVDKESEGKRKKYKSKEWILSNYSEIAKALHSGHLVFYSVELSACVLPDQMKAERLSFGDFVDSFESRQGDGRREEASIRFWQTKFVQGDEGLEEITREMTIKSKGRVEVRLYRKYTDSHQLYWQQSAHCKLFDPQTGLGGVKITSRPAVEVHEISTFGRFRSSLRRGRRQVRMIIDLTQCHGRTHGVRSIMGSTVRAYDFINSGKAIEVSQLTPDTDHAHYTLLTGHFLNNGEVIFIISLQPRTGSDVDRHFPLFHQDSTYRCALSGSNVPNSSGPWGVKLFYTT